MIVSLCLSWKLTLVMLAFIPINFIANNINLSQSTNKTANKSSSTTNLETESARVTLETVENIRTVVSLGNEAHFLEVFSRINSERSRNFWKKAYWQALLYSISNCLSFFQQAVAYAFGFYLMKTDGLSVANLFRVFSTIVASSQTLGRLYALMPDQKASKQAAKSVFGVIDRRSKIDSLSEDGLKPKNVIGNIKFKNVFFNYPNRPNVRILEGLNLDIKNNETNALIGHSGIYNSFKIYNWFI